MGLQVDRVSIIDVLKRANQSSRNKYTSSLFKIVFDSVTRKRTGKTINPELLKEYGKLRKPNGDAILELALRNYIEMRDLTADKDFLLQKKIEGRFASKHPEKWIPLYSQVTFSHIPYHGALSSGIRQNEIMKEVMNRPDIEEVWDSEEIENEILKRI
jgi:kynurenine 3-monooxygenase